MERERKAKLQVERQLEERQKKVDEQRRKEEQKRMAVEEKRKQKQEEEKVDAAWAEPHSGAPCWFDFCDYKSNIYIEIQIFISVFPLYSKKKRGKTENWTRTVLISPSLSALGLGMKVALL